jgi:hypothetical protein
MFNYIYGPFPNFSFIGVEKDCKHQVPVLTDNNIYNTVKFSPFTFCFWDLPYCKCCHNDLTNTLIYAVSVKPIDFQGDWEKLFETCDAYYIDYTNNFTQEERDFIESLDIHDLNDLFRLDISKSDVKSLLKSYRHAYEVDTDKDSDVALTGHTYINIGNHWFVVRVFSDKKVKFVDKI